MYNSFGNGGSPPIYFGLAFVCNCTWSSCSITMPSKMERDIFELLWPIFGFGRYFGFFPCKKSKDLETGKVFLEPISWKIQWILYLTLGVVIGQSGSVATTILFSISGNDMEKVMQCVTNANHFGGTMDTLTVFFLISFMVLACLLMQWGNFIIRNEICELSKMELKCAKTKDGKILKPFIAITILVVVFSILSTLNNIVVSVMCTSLDWTYILMLFVPSVISMLFMAYPYLVFMALTLECFTLISDEIDTLNQKFVSSYQELILESLVKFIKHLEIIKRLLSPNFFCITTLYSLEIMVLVYIMIFQFAMSFNNLTTLLICTMASNSVFLFMLILLIWYLNIWSHNTTEEINNLKNRLRNLYIEDTKCMEYEGQIVPPSFVKICIMEQLNDFRGFDAKRYFILGKSFLKNLLAFCTTYFVILIQFRLTEVANNN